MNSPILPQPFPVPPTPSGQNYKIFIGPAALGQLANLVTDGLPATAICFNKQDSDIMKAKPRKVSETVITGWLFFCYLVIGANVGIAAVAGFIWWYVYSDSGPKLPYSELTNFESCSTRETTYPCSIFEDQHPSTVSRTVVVEMFNALNNLSEYQSLLVIPPWSN